MKLIRKEKKKGENEEAIFWPVWYDKILISHLVLKKGLTVNDIARNWNIIESSSDLQADKHRKHRLCMYHIKSEYHKIKLRYEELFSYNLVSENEGLNYYEFIRWFLRTNTQDQIPKDKIDSLAKFFRTEWFVKSFFCLSQEDMAKLKNKDLGMFFEGKRWTFFFKENVFFRLTDYFLKMLWIGVNQGLLKGLDIEIDKEALFSGTNFNEETKDSISYVIEGKPPEEFGNALKVFNEFFRPQIQKYSYQSLSKAIQKNNFRGVNKADRLRTIKVLEGKKSNSKIDFYELPKSVQRLILPFLKKYKK